VDQLDGELFTGEAPSGRRGAHGHWLSPDALDVISAVAAGDLEAGEPTMWQ
jgi:hypothetical protein